MNFIKKIFTDDVDASVHAQFEKYGIGEYKDKALVSISISANKVKIKTSYEFTNDFVKFLMDKTSAPIKINGMILYNGKELQESAPFQFENIKVAMGIRKHLINTSLTKEQILPLIEHFPNAIFMLNFSTDYGELKIKQKPPKSPKSSADKEAKADFCTFSTKDSSFVNEFAFDIDEKFSKCDINHTFIIDEVMIPDEYKKDFAKARKFGKRKGKVIRTITIDNRQITKEKNFIV